MDMRKNTVVRIPCGSYDDVKELALRLEADGYSVARRPRAVLVPAETREDGERLVRKLRLGAVVVTKRRARRPRLAFGLVAGLRRI
jgi:hypothetical protein